MTDVYQDVYGTLAKTFVDTADEIVKARRKHGPQKHLPLIHKYRQGTGFYADLEKRYKKLCDRALEREESCWDFILLEEVFEALAAIASGDLDEGRAELIQVVAMAASMVEIVDEQIAASNALESLS